MAMIFKEAQDVRIKGGMPVDVSGYYVSDETGADFECLEIFWRNTEKTVTKKFRDSLTKSDWDSIVSALERA